MTTEYPRAPQLTATAAWHRLHPLSPFVRAGRQMMSLIVVVLGISLLNQRQDRGDLVTDVVVIAVALVGGFVSWLVTRWQVADGVLRIDTGLLRRESQRVPLSQIQAVDMVQSGLARVLGLAELQLRVAGGDSARGGRLACLRLADAEELRRELLALAGPAAAGAGAGVPAPAGMTADAAAGAAEGAPVPGLPVPGPPASAASLTTVTAPAAGQDRLLFRVRAGRLPAAIVLTVSGARAAVVVAATAVAVLLSHSAGTVAPFLPVVLGVVLALWHQFNGEYGTTIVTAADGLRLRSGLIQTTAETIRPGRIQAVRLAEPLIWRAFGVVPAGSGCRRRAPAAREFRRGPPAAVPDPGRQSCRSG